MLDGHRVIVCDDLSSGNESNIKRWLNNKNFTFIKHDIVKPLEPHHQTWLKLDEIYHLASPASPSRYMKKPIATIQANTWGTLNLLELGKRFNSTVLVASSSEVYGDPKVHPQSEDYRGNVNPFGPRSCYDEGKRISESLAYAYRAEFGTSIRIARIFNTYGPRMNVNDGRVVSNFVNQALRNESITIYGTGKQTRSFQYITDLIGGLVELMNTNVQSPINLGNPEETSILNLALTIKELTKPTSASKIVFLEKLEDDPIKRKPDASKALRELGWSASVKFNEGLLKTISYFEEIVSRERKQQSSSMTMKDIFVKKI